MRRVLSLAAVILTLASVAAAQSPDDRKRARIQNQLGWEDMRTERWESAARSFQQAIDLDRTFADAYYGLGRANMALKKYISAIDALVACRDIYRSQAGRHFANQQDAQRARSDRLTDLDEQIRQVQAMPPTMQQADLLRQLNNHRRDVQDAYTKGSSLSVEASVPAFVSLSLGSAYFRSGKMEDAEREYRATIAADNRSGEAHSNLAVVLLETGRITEAEAALKAAKKTGFKVNPALEQEIQNRKKGG